MKGQKISYSKSIMIFKEDFMNNEAKQANREILKQTYGLFDHQIAGIEFLVSRKKAILADEMGLGKTRTAIIAAKEEKAKTIIVCPASLKINWKREIQSVYPDDVVDVVDSKSNEISYRSDWVIINYDIVEKWIPQIETLIEGGHLDTIILDEAHYIKGKSQRATAIVGGFISPKGGTRHKLKGLANQMERVYLLTGTPLLNRPVELFNLLRAIKHPLSQNRTEFVKKYCGAFFIVRVQDLATGKAFMVEQKRFYKYYGDRKKYRVLFRFLDESGATNLPELWATVRDSMLRRKKKDVIDLPEKIISVMDCELSDEWKKIYDHAWDSYIDFLRANQIDGDQSKLDNVILARHLVEITKLKQVCSQSKIPRIIQDVKNAVEQGQKVIIFSQYTDTIDRIMETLKTEEIKAVSLSGSDDMNERQISVDAFQNNDDVKAIVLNIKAGGVGINLTAGSIVMFADMDWSPEIHRQAEDRAHRIGQEGTVNVYYYVQGGTVEEDILAILAEKKGIADAVLEGQNGDLKVESAQERFLSRMAGKLPTGGV